MTLQNRAAAAESVPVPLPKTSEIKLSREGSILVAAICRPPHNLLTAAFLQDLGVCREAFQDAAVRAVVFTGSGAVFSKGFDIDAIAAGAGQPDAAALQSANDLLTFLSELRKPVVAAIDGACFGGGLELALACHVRVCSEKALLGLTELSAGVIPGLGGVPRLCRVVGEAKALEMMLLGDIVTASRAADIGLVSRVFPRQDFLRKALLFVKTIIAAPAESIAELLDAMAAWREAGDEAAIRQSADGFRRLMAGRS